MTVSIQLSDKQRAIINHIADGMTKKEIALKMGLSESYVAVITNGLIALFDCKNSAGLVDFAWRNGLRKIETV